jgi:uncharacterized protein (DUF697 family)
MPETDQPADNGPGDQPADVGGAVTRLTDADLGAGERARLLGTVAASAGGGRRRGLRRFVMGPRAAVHWALETLLDIAPRLPIRDLDALRRHHGGKSGDELAEALIKSASRAAAAIGAAGGGVASVEWAAPPTLLTAPVLVAAETVAVVAVEIKLIAELHEVYGAPVRGSATEKGTALLGAWAHRRGVSLSLLNPGGGLTTILGAGMRKELQSRLIKRMGRNLTSIGPLLTGAAVAAELNRRATRGLGEAIRDDLRKAPRQLR